jgi:hypothetical protein
VRERSSAKSFSSTRTGPHLGRFLVGHGIDLPMQFSLRHRWIVPPEPAAPQPVFRVIAWDGRVAPSTLTARDDCEDGLSGSAARGLARRHRVSAHRKAEVEDEESVRVGHVGPGIPGAPIGTSDAAVEVEIHFVPVPPIRSQSEDDGVAPFVPGDVDGGESDRESSQRATPPEPFRFPVELIVGGFDHAADFAVAGVDRADIVSGALVQAGHPDRGDRGLCLRDPGRRAPACGGAQMTNQATRIPKKTRPEIIGRRDAWSISSLNIRCGRLMRSWTRPGRGDGGAATGDLTFIDRVRPPDGDVGTTGWLGSLQDRIARVLSRRGKVGRCSSERCRSS